MRKLGEIHEQDCSLSEGQEVSGEYRFDLFGKTDASEGFALAVTGKSKRPKHFLLFVYKSLKVQNISQSEIFMLRRAGGFRRTSLSFRSERTVASEVQKSSERRTGKVCSICSERTILYASEVRKIRMAESLFCLFGKNGSKRSSEN